MGVGMKKCKVMTLVMVLAIGIFAAVDGAHATLISVGDTITFADGPGTTGGGEFYAKVYHNGSLVSEFISFCVETDEYLDYSSAGFVIAGINTTAYGGGADSNIGDPLSSETAYLYYNFANGTLAGYDHSAAAANSLQRAIWYLEGELLPGTARLNDYLNDVKALQWVALAENNKDGSLYGVQVLNLTYPNGTPAQDQLYVSVPEPGTLLLLGLGLTGLAIRTRRKTVTRY
jgi:hypothetical protein